MAYFSTINDSNWQESLVRVIQNANVIILLLMELATGTVSLPIAACVDLFPGTTFEVSDKNWRQVMLVF